MEPEVLDLQPEQPTPEKPKKDFSLLIIILVGILFIGVTSYFSYRAGVNAKNEEIAEREVQK